MATGKLLPLTKPKYRPPLWETAAFDPTRCRKFNISEGSEGASGIGSSNASSAAMAPSFGYTRPCSRLSMYSKAKAFACSNKALDESCSRIPAFRPSKSIEATPTACWDYYIFKPSASQDRMPFRGPGSPRIAVQPSANTIPHCTGRTFAHLKPGKEEDSHGAKPE